MSPISKARELHQQASVRFNPEVLSSAVKFDDDVPIVDKEKLMLSHDDESLFCVILNSMFCWDYTTDFKSTTIYFDVQNDIIFAGVYDEQRHVASTRVALATKQNSNLTAHYTYPETKFDKIKENLSKNS